MFGTTNGFILFILISLILYYLVPGRWQWVVLLSVSWGYYLYTSPWAGLFLLFSTVVSFVCARVVEKTIRNTGDRKAGKRKVKKVLILGMLLDFGALAVLKYTGFVVLNLNRLFHSDISIPNLLLPLGISYYTFQTVGYLLDVYWGRTDAEKNFFRYALFVSFFPQLVQGPIGRYSVLAEQFAKAHAFSLHQMRYGLERILWGLFKKMLLADWAVVYADAIFGDPDRFSGIAVFGLLMNTVQLYGNFSGGIDVALGVASLFGITLDENFKRPFFAVSISDFWTRWHISLGTWMKDYVMFPLTLSRNMSSLGKKCRKVFGKKKGRLIPICISNLIVFFIVGIWHGPTWSNIGWGLYNGVIVAFSSFFAPEYETVKNKLHINDNASGYRLFMMIRTFILINISWYFDCVPTFGTALGMMKYSVTRFAPAGLLAIPAGKLGTSYTPYALLTLGLGCLLLLIVSILQERGLHIREKMAALPLPVEFGICLILLICVSLFSPMAAARGFIYAQF